MTGIQGRADLVLLLQLCKLLVLLENALLDIQLHLVLAQALCLRPGSCCRSFPALSHGLPLSLRHYAL